MVKKNAMPDQNRAEAGRLTPKLWIDGAVLTVMLALHLFLGTCAVNRQAATYDEGVHLVTGYHYLRTGSYKQTDHPPLLRVLAALPLLVSRPDSFDESPEAKGEDMFAYADLFLYHNRLSADSILAAGRHALFWGLSPLLCVLIYFWTLKLGGRIAAAAAAFLYVLCPVILANAPLIMTDFGVTVFCFAAFYTLYKIILTNKPHSGLYVLFGLLLGAALASKTSAMIMFGLMPLSTAAYWLMSGDSGVLRRAARILAISLPAIALVLLCAYHFNNTWLFWETIRWVFAQTQHGVLHLSYLFGYASTDGWWYYFPVCFLLKTPLILLFLLALAVFKCLEQLINGARGTLGAWRAGLCSGPWAVVAAFVLLPAAIWMAVACTSKFQIGLRHILPVYPFCCVAAGIAAAKVYDSGSLFRRGCLWLMAAGYVWSAFAAYPDYFSDFNSLVPDKIQSFRYLAEANLDIGQGLKELGGFVKSFGSPPIYLSYFGTANPHAYGIRYVPVAFFTDVPRKGDDIDPAEAQPLIFAISASNRAAMYYNNRKLMKWLENYTPGAWVGNSIFVYDFTKEPRALEVIADILQNTGDGPRAARLREWANKKS